VSDWQVRIEDRNFGLYVDLVIYRSLPNGRYEVMSEDSKGQKIIVTIGEGEGVPELKPTLRLNQHEAGQIMKAFAEAIHNQGVSTDNDARIAGLLEATKEHLSDMRKLVFRSRNIEDERTE
jgi:hypothetical protein